MQAEYFHDSVRPGLIAMLPRLKRFADVLVGARGDGKDLLGRALRSMLAKQYCYQRGSALDVGAFGEVYRQWLQELRDHLDPVARAKIDDTSFCELFFREEGGYFDAPVVDFLGALPPQQRLTLLLVYGEGFEHEDAASILDVPAETIAARLVRMSAALADRISARTPVQAAAIVQTLYPKGSAHP